MKNNNRQDFSDKALIEKVLSGDTHAFAIIIKNTEALVAQIVFKMINNPDDRKDIAQDIYLKVYKNLAGFKYEAKLSTWIAQVGYNTCLDYIRKKKLSFPGDQEENNTKDVNVSNETSVFLHRRELSTILKEEIEQLPPVFKTLIGLYHIEELSYGEIAQVTGLPEGTVKSYLFRARRSLKNNLLETYKKEDL